MEMYREIIKQLRATASRSKRKLLNDAADAIENLLRSNEAMQDVVKRQSDFNDRLVAEVLRKDEEIDRLTAESDALLRDLKDADIDCEFCGHRPAVPDDCPADCAECQKRECTCCSCIDNRNWEWRGIVEGQ